MVALSWDGTPGRAPPGRSGCGPARGGAWGDWLALSRRRVGDQGGEARATPAGSAATWSGSAPRAPTRSRSGSTPARWSAFELLRMRYHEGEPVPVEDAATRGRPQRDDQGRPARHPAPQRLGHPGVGLRQQRVRVRPARSSSRLDHAVVHHTASTNSYTQAQVPGLIDGIRALPPVLARLVRRRLQLRRRQVRRHLAGPRRRHQPSPSSGATPRASTPTAWGSSCSASSSPGASPASASPTAAMIDSHRPAAGLEARPPRPRPQRHLHRDQCGQHPLQRRHAGDPPGDRRPPRHQPTPPAPGPTWSARWGPCGSRSPPTWAAAAAAAAAAGTFAPSPRPRTWSTASTSTSCATRAPTTAGSGGATASTPGPPTATPWSCACSSRPTSRATRPPASGSTSPTSAASPTTRGSATGGGRWTAAPASGSVSAAFARSPEFTSRYGALSDGGFVDLVYRNVLGRSPDAAGATATGRTGCGPGARTGAG